MNVPREKRCGGKCNRKRWINSKHTKEEKIMTSKIIEIVGKAVVEVLVLVFKEVEKKGKE